MSLRERNKRERKRYDRSEKERDFRLERGERERDRTATSASGMARNHKGVALGELELVGGRGRFCEIGSLGKREREWGEGAAQWWASLRSCCEKWRGEGTSAMGGRGRELPLSSLDWAPLAQLFRFFNYYIFLAGVVNSLVCLSLNGVKSPNCPSFWTEFHTFPPVFFSFPFFFFC